MLLADFDFLQAACAGGGNGTAGRLFVIGEGMVRFLELQYVFFRSHDIFDAKLSHIVGSDVYVADLLVVAFFQRTDLLDRNLGLVGKILQGASHASAKFGQGIAKRLIIADFKDFRLLLRFFLRLLRGFLRRRRRLLRLLVRHHRRGGDASAEPARTGRRGGIVRLLSAEKSVDGVFRRFIMARLGGHDGLEIDHGLAAFVRLVVPDKREALHRIGFGFFSCLQHLYDLLASWSVFAVC